MKRRSLNMLSAVTLWASFGTVLACSAVLYAQNATSEVEAFNSVGSTFGNNGAPGSGPGGGPPPGSDTQPNPSPTPETIEARFTVAAQGKQIKLDCASCHWMEVHVDNRKLNFEETITLKKGKAYEVTVKDNPQTSGTPPQGATPPEHDTQTYTVWPIPAGNQTITPIPSENSADPPKGFLVQKDQILQYLIDNSEGLLAENKPWPQNPSEEPMSKKARLLPFELRDINDHADTGDDVSITPWDATKPIANQNIAWIDAHTSAQNSAPRMPQLEFRMPGLPQGITIEAKLEVKYERGNGARHPSRTDKDGNTDTVKIPADGSFKPVTSDTWQIWNEYPLQGEGFFGGDATLTYKLKSGTSEILAPQTIKFRIGGKNPDDARCRSYIETLSDAGPNGSLWFAYAIAKSESKDYNGQGTCYNQFLELPTHVQDAGRPLWGNDGGTTPGGYGMIQVTGDASDSTANIPRKQIWNWQDNVAAGLAILASKRTAAIAWMTQQKNANNANGTALPDHTVGIVTFSDGTARTMTHAVTIKLYNGASRAPAGFVDSGSAPGFRLDPQGAGHYCFWRNASNEWALNRFNDPPDPIQPFNYVARVCGEVEN